MGDLIDRQDAIDRINKQMEHLRPDIYSRDKICDAAYRICAEFIERLPSAQPEIEERMSETEQNVPNDDFISRKRAIDELMEDFKRIPTNAIRAKTVIEHLPSAQPEQRWIPCSEETGEGFPKEDGRYYVTEQNYGFYLDSDYKKKVAHMSIFKDGDFTDRYYDENHSNITAWCKLPEPYGGD